MKKLALTLAALQLAVSGCGDDAPGLNPSLGGEGVEGQGDIVSGDDAGTPGPGDGDDVSADTSDGDTVDEDASDGAVDGDALEGDAFEDVADGGDADGGDGPDADVTGDADGGDETAEVRVLHLSPSAPAVDVYANGEGPVVSGLEYTNGTGYLTVPAGDLTAAVTVAGTPLSSAVLTETVTLAEGTASSAVAYDTADGLALLALGNDRSPPALGNLRVRAIHTAFGVGTVDLYAGGALLVSDLAFGAASGFHEVPAGQYTVEIDATGEGEIDLACALPSLPAGTIADVFASLGPSGVQLVAWFDDGATAAIPCAPPVAPQTAEVRVLHLSPSAPAVDVYANGAGPVASGLAYTDGTGYLAVPAGDFTAAVTVAGTPLFSAVLTQTLTLAEGTASSAIAYDTADGLALLALGNDRSPPALGNLRVRAIHTAFGVGTVDLYAGGAPLVSDLAFGAASGFLEVPAGQYTVEIDATGEGEIDLACALPSLPAGTIADVFASLGPSGVQLVAWFDDGSTAAIPCAPPVTPGTAEVRVLHLSPSAPAVDVYANGAGPVASGLAYTDGTGYLAVPAGDFTAAVTVAGTPLFSAVLTQTLTLVEGTASSAVAYDTADGLALLALGNDRSPPALGNLRVRAIHTAFGVGTVDLYAGGALLVSDLAFGAASGFHEVPAGQYTVEIDATGEGEIDLACALPSLPAGTIADVFASLGPSGVQLVAWFDDGATAAIPCAPPVAPQTAEVRVLHLSPSAPAVDVYANGAGPVASGLAYTDGTGYLAVPAGDFTAAVTVAGTPLFSAVLTQTLTLAEGTASSAIAYDTADGLALLALGNDRSPPALGNLRVRAIHTAFGVGTVDLYAGGAPLVSDLAFGAASGFLEVPAGQYTVEIDATGEGEIDLACALPSLPAGTIADVFASLGPSGVQLVAWFDDGSTAAIPCAPPVTPGTAEVRVLHLSPSAPAVDVYANGAGPVASGLAYTDGTGYLAVPAGDFTAAVTVAGTPLFSAVLTQTLTLVEGTASSAVAYDTADGLALLALSNDRSPPALGNLRVRAIHTAFGVGTVDLYAGGALLVSDLAFGAASGFHEVPAGQYTVEIDATGEGEIDLACALPSLPAGTIADVFASLGPSGVQLVAWFDDGATAAIPCAPPVAPQTAEVRVLHLSPSAPAVDVYANGAGPVASDLAYTDGTGYLIVPAGDFTAAVTVAGTPLSSAVLTETLTLAEGTASSAIAYDTADGLALLALSNDRSPPALGNLRVRAIHTAFGVGTVDLYAGGAPLVSDLAFGAASGFLEVPAGQYTVEIDATGEGEIDLACALPSLPAGTIADVFATLGPSGVQLVAWFDDGATAAIPCAPPVAPQTAEVRVLHLSPSAPAVDVYANGAGPVASDLAYTDGTGYLTVPAGDFTAAVTVAGSPLSSAVLQAEANLAPGAAASAVAYDAPTGLAALLLDDDRAAPPAGQIRVRAIHLAAGIGPVDLYSGANVLVPDLAFGASSAALTLPAAAYTIGIDATGEGTVDLLCALPSLPAGTIADLFATASGATVSLVAWLDDGATTVVPCTPPPTANLRAIHVIPGAPTVVATRGSTQVGDPFIYPNGTAFVAVPLAAAPTVFSVVGSGDVVASTPATALTKDASYTAVVYGSAATPAALQLTEDLSPVPTGQVRARFIHTAAGVGNVDLYSLPNPTTKVKVTANLGYGKAGVYLQGVNNPVDIGVDTNLDGQIDFRCPKVSSPNQSVTNVFLVLQTTDLLFVRQANTGAVTSQLCTPVAPPAPAASLRAIHLSPDAPTVDLFVGSTRTLTGLAFPSGSAYASTAAATSTLAVVPAGGALASAVLTGPGVTFAAATKYTAAVYGSLSALAAVVLVDDAPAPGPGRIGVRAVHTAEGVGPVDLLVGGASVATGLAYGKATPWLDLAEGAYDIGVDLTSDATPEFVCSTPVLAAGVTANVFAVLDGAELFLAVQPQSGATLNVACTPFVADTAFIRALHLSPSAPEVDVYADGALAAGSLAYTSGTPYIEVPAGPLAVDVALAGAGIGEAVLSAVVPLAAATSTSAVAYDTPNGLALLTLEDDRTAPSAGEISVNIVHTALGVGPVDLYNVTSLLSVPLVTDLAFADSTGALALPAGQYTIGVDATDDGDLEFTCALPSLPAGTIASVFATFSGDALRLVAWFDDGATAVIACEKTPEPVANLRAIHLSPNAPAVDVTFGAGASGVTIATAAPFLLGSVYTPVASGAGTLRVSASGSSGAPVLQVPITAPSGSRRSAAVYGPLAALSAVVIDDDATGLAPGSARIRAIHTASGVGTVDVLLVGDATVTPLWDDLAYGAASTTLDVPGAAYRVGLSTDTDAAPELVAQLPALPSGAVANVFAVADSAGAPSFVVQLDDGSTFNAPLMPFDAPGDTLIRAVYIGTSPATASLSITGTATYQASLTNGTLTPFQSIPAGNVQITVTGGFNFPVGGPATLQGSRAYTLVIYNATGAFGATLAASLLVDDVSPYPGRGSRVRAGHYARSVTSVDFAQVSPTSQLLLDDATFPTASPFQPTADGALAFNANTDADAAPELAWSGPSLPPGRSLLSLLTTGPNATVRLYLITRLGLVLATPQ